jgi:hypothetical protein
MFAGKSGAGHDTAKSGAGPDRNCGEVADVVIPSETLVRLGLGGSRCETFKVAPRVPSTLARDDAYSPAYFRAIGPM